MFDDTMNSRSVKKCGSFGTHVVDSDFTPSQPPPISGEEPMSPDEPTVPSPTSGRARVGFFVNHMRSGLNQKCKVYAHMGEG
jgi:hypothetical protein